MLWQADRKICSGRSVSGKIPLSPGVAIRQHKPSPVESGSRDQRYVVIDFSAAGMKLSVEALTTGIPGSVFQHTAAFIFHGECCTSQVNAKVNERECQPRYTAAQTFLRGTYYCIVLSLSHNFTPTIGIITVVTAMPQDVVISTQYCSVTASNADVSSSRPRNSPPRKPLPGRPQRQAVIAER